MSQKLSVAKLSVAKPSAKNPVPQNPVPQNQFRRLATHNAAFVWFDLYFGTLRRRRFGGVRRGYAPHPLRLTLLRLAEPLERDSLRLDRLVR